MRIKNRLTPYPVLNNYSDDYIDSSFVVDYEVSAQFTMVYGKLSFRLQNGDIEGLIKDDRAEYVVHIECPVTCYREIKRSTEPEIEFSIDSRKLSKSIEIRTFVALKEDVSQYSSAKFHSDYEGRLFQLKAHQVIAIGTAQNFDIQEDDREIESLPSIIQMVKVSGRRKGTLSVNTDGDDRILIGLEERAFESYARLGKTIFKDTIFSLVLLPALIIVLQRMIANKDEPDINTRHWFQVINALLEKNGYSIDKISADNDSLLTVCQLVFAEPIERSFKELNQRIERM